MATSKVKTETKLAMALVRNLEAIAPLSLKDRKAGKMVGGVFLPGWQSKAIEVAADLKSKYPSPQSALSGKKRLLAELGKFDKSWLLDAATFHPVKTSIAHFRESLNLLFAIDQAAVNDSYRGRVSDRSGDASRIECDLSQWLVKAFDTLTKVAQGADRKEIKWEDVSCALALTTGRRMSELHYSAAFTKSGDHELIFTGQLKGKSRAVDGDKLINHPFTIPCLVPTELAIAGLEWLEREGKRADRGDQDGAERVNKVWAKYLSKRCKTDWEIIPDATWQAVDPADKWSFHKFRGIYFVACLANLEQTANFSSIKRLAPSLLGDADLSAIEPYERIDIAPDSLTNI